MLKLMSRKAQSALNGGWRASWEEEDRFDSIIYDAIKKVAETDNLSDLGFEQRRSILTQLRHDLDPFKVDEKLAERVHRLNAIIENLHPGDSVEDLVHTMKTTLPLKAMP